MAETRRRNGANVVVIAPTVEILCVQHNYRDHKWALPGGGIETGETPRQGAVRETVEETGLLPTGDINLVAIFAQRPEGVTFLYESHSYKGTIRNIDESEIVEIKFLSINEIISGKYPFGLGYARMIAQWWKCRTGQSITPFEGKLSDAIEVAYDENVLLI